MIYTEFRLYNFVPDSNTIFKYNKYFIHIHIILSSIGTTEFLPELVMDLKFSNTIIQIHKFSIHIN